MERKLNLCSLFLKSLKSNNGSDFFHKVFKNAEEILILSGRDAVVKFTP